MYPHVAEFWVATTVLHAVVSTPHVICLHRLSDLTSINCPTDSNAATRQFDMHSFFVPMIAPTFVTVREVALHPIFASK